MDTESEVELKMDTESEVELKRKIEYDIIIKRKIKCDKEIIILKDKLEEKHTNIALHKLSTELKNKERERNRIETHIDVLENKDERKERIRLGIKTEREKKEP